MKSLCRTYIFSRQLGTYGHSAVLLFVIHIIDESELTSWMTPTDLFFSQICAQPWYKAMMRVLIPMMNCI